MSGQWTPPPPPSVSGADTTAPASDPWDDPLGLRKYLPDWANPDRGGGINIAPIVKSAEAASSALDFITDIPRVATTLLGLILIIAGIFALTRGPAVQIVTSAVKEAATS